MKNNLKKLILLLSCILIILIIILIKFKNNILLEEQTNNQYIITLQDFKLNQELKKYLKDSYEVSINKINHSTIYGDIHDTSSNNDLFITKNIFSYDYKNDKFEIYNFNYDYRILNYYILNDYIYASIVFKNTDNAINYNWSIIKFNKNLEDGKLLKEGKIIDPVSAPVFYYSDLNKSLYIISINDNFSLTNDIIVERKQTLDITKVDSNSDNISIIKEYTGDYVNKTGTMLCNTFDIQIYENELLFCTTDYESTQEIKSINLNNYNEQTIFYNNLKNNWIITSFQRNTEGIYVGKMDINNNQNGKTSYYNITTKQLQEIESNVFYGRTPFISNYMLFHNLEKWSIYDSKENKLYSVMIAGKYKNIYLYPTFYILSNNKILVKSTNNYFYIGTLNF